MTIPNAADAAVQDLDDIAIEAAVLAKIVRRLIPFLGALYAFCIIDRTNVNIAANPMRADLHYTNTVYALGAGMFYIGYFLFEVPSNLVMERIGARRWIARIMITWGLISAAFMFVRSPASFYTLRFLLGVAEAGFFPGILLYFTYWIPGRMRSRVLARFLSLQAYFGLIGGPLGGLLLKMNGLYGLKGWQWLFLMEGLPSFVLGFAVLRWLPEKPHNAAWLTIEETEWIDHNLQKDQKVDNIVHTFTARTALTNPRILVLCTIFLLTATGGNALGFFVSQLIKARSGNMWNDSVVAASQVIPALVGAFAMVYASSHSDRTGRRRLHVAGGYLIAGVALLACIKSDSAQAVLFSLSVYALGERIAAGSYWAAASNLMGAKAAAGGLAMVNSVGNIGGFIGPLIMGKLRDTYHGSFTPGLAVAGILVLLGAVACTALRDASPSPAQSTS